MFDNAQVRGLREGSAFFSPNHLVHHACIRLDELDDLIGNILVRVIGDRDAEVTVFIHLNSCIDCLEQAFFIDTREDEAGFIERLGSLGGGADADCGERLADARKE